MDNLFCGSVFVLRKCLGSSRKDFMNKNKMMYVAQDGSYGDATGLLIVMGKDVNGDFYDALDRPQINLWSWANKHFDKDKLHIVKKTGMVISKSLHKAMKADAEANGLTV